MIYTHAAAGIAGAALASLLTWNVQAWRYDAQLAAIRTEAATQLAQQHADALAREQANAQAVARQAQKSKEVADELLDAMARQRDAARTDAARLDRLRGDEAARAARYRAMSEAGAAACSDLADRAAALDGHVVEGVAVVDALRGDLERRDAEVAALMGQVVADRALMDGSSQAGSD